VKAKLTTSKLQGEVIGSVIKSGMQKSKNLDFADDIFSPYTLGIAQ
jgi:hypothetical protein